jgi:hypothetical protein
MYKLFQNMQEASKETCTINVVQIFVIYCILGSLQAIYLSEFIICIIHEIIATQ